MLQRIDIDFSRHGLAEVLNSLDNRTIPDWLMPAFAFLNDCHHSGAVTCHTSGTTGAPKAITFNGVQLEYSAKASLNFFQLKKGSRVLLPLSCNHIAGKMMLLRAVVGQLRITLIEPTSNPFKFITALDKFDFCPLVPMQLHEIFKSKEDVNRLGVLLLGGAGVHPTLLANLQKAGVRAWASFGMTETMTHFALKSLSPTEDEYYSCIADYQVSTDEQGCLVVLNPIVFKQGLVTNDTVEVRNSKEFIWLGRSDYVINSGGVKLHPEQIEAKIKRVIADAIPFVLVGIKDEKLGESLCLLSEKVSISEMDQERIKKAVLAYEFPKSFRVVEEFKRTESGKIKREIPN